MLDVMFVMSVRNCGETNWTIAGHHSLGNYLGNPANIVFLILGG